MKVKINNIKVPCSNTTSLKSILSHQLRIKEEDIIELIISSKSIDARKKNNIVIIYSVILKLSDKCSHVLKNKNVIKYNDNIIRMPYTNFNDEYRPVIVGFGPAGIFAALYLTRCNAKPIIIERGSKIEERVNEVNDFLINRKLNPNSNIQFGEGGAGTFSDGKLTTNANDPLISYILNEFVRYGAKENIKYDSLPHIGTDFLRKIIKNMRTDMELRGAEFHFNTVFNSLEQNDDYVIAKCSNGMEFKTRHLLLGLGHSARDTLKMLYSNGVAMEPKSFSMGVRIEHKRDFINYMQYGESAKYLEAASYKCAVHLDNGRSLYTFCMCPGGEVMASTSDNNSIVTNGMSYNKRDKDNSNAALLVNVDPDDYYINSPLDGLDYQEKYERKAFDISKDYRAPANLVKEFLNGEVAKEIRCVIPSYPHGIVLADLKECLPNYVYETLRSGLPLMAKKLPGFDQDDAILTAIESRSSSPVRIIRDENGITNRYIYPIGEGAGYAGGIMTAALDGLKCALKITKDFNRISGKK